MLFQQLHFLIEKPPRQVIFEQFYLFAFIITDVRKQQRLMGGKSTNESLCMFNSTRCVSLHFSLVGKQKYFPFRVANCHLSLISPLSNEYSSEKKNTEIRSWNPTTRADTTLSVIFRLFVTSPRQEQNHRDRLNKADASGEARLPPSRLPPSPVPAPPSVPSQHWTRKSRFILPPKGRRSNAELQRLRFMGLFQTDTHCKRTTKPGHLLK